MPESRLSIVEQMVVVELGWDSIPMDCDYKKFYENYKEATCNLSNNIIYAFEGKHQAYPTRVVLYIGKTEAGDKRQRPCDTAKARFYGKPKIMPCVYSDMILRWATIPNIPDTDMEKWGIPENVDPTEKEKMTPTKVLEQILIHAMKPALNSTYADGYMPDNPCFRKLVVCNKGNKGLLLPVVYGDYFARKKDWEPF